MSNHRQETPSCARDGFRKLRIVAVALLTWIMGPGLATSEAADWPMWRYDAGHTAASPDNLPEALHLAWTRAYEPRVPVWDDPLNQDLMPYDAIFEPVIAGERVFLGFNDTDKVVALDVRSGEELWRFYTDGPVRFSPVVFRDKVYFTSDDGHLYCVGAADGQLQWRIRGGPSAQKVIGNRRLISAWPARGGPVERDGIVYFAASIFPFMGTFLYAVEAESGGIRWLNDSTGASFLRQPHDAPAFAGVAPQGQLAATEKMLLVPGGRSCPAVLDRATGEVLHFRFGNKGEGGSFVAADESRFFVHTRLRGTTAFQLSDGNSAKFQVNEPVLAGGMTYAANTPGTKDGRRSPAVIQAFAADKKLLWQVVADGTGDLIKAGDRLYAAGEQGISAIDLPRGNAPARMAWSIPVSGRVRRLVAGSGRLLAVTEDGRIMAFGPHAGAARTLADEVQPIAASPQAVGRAERLLRQTGVRDGYALWIGLDDSQLLEAVAAASDLHIVAMDRDADRVARLRLRLDRGGLYGKRVAVHQADPLSFQPPVYVASLVVVGKSAARECAQQPVLERVYETVRPYGGKLWIAVGGHEAEAIGRLAEAKLVRASVVRGVESVLVTREGALPGAASWTHAYGDIANTVKSNDQRVKLPLGLLWFGGNSNLDVLPRHGHGPSEQVIGGRLFIEGINSMHARDVYTGRVLWKREFPDLGIFNIYYDHTYAETPLSTAYNQVHIPGANARGTNYVATPEGVYLAVGSSCLLLDSGTGSTLRQFDLPATGGRRPLWGFIGVYRNLLLAGTGFGDYSGRLGYKYEPEGKRGVAWSPDHNGSLGLLAFDRHSGEVLWKTDAVHSFLHNGIVAGRDRIYCLDRLPRRVEDQLRRRGEPLREPQLIALDARNGQRIWHRSGDSFGTWLGYSEKHDVLLEAGAAATDRSPDEASRGMAAYRAADGQLLWAKMDLSYNGPCMIHNDAVITNTTSYKESRGAFHLLDGAPVLVDNPITGEPWRWTFTRAYGCNTAVASEHLLTFRSGAAGYYDLATHSGTGNFGGFRSGCSSNLIAADGVLSAPDYTRTCTCAYQNQTSLALVPMPEIEIWTYSTFGIAKDTKATVRRLGLNLGAPGDRRADDGTLWIDYPSVGGSSPEIPIELAGATTFFRYHSSRVSGESPGWIAGSGAEGLQQISVWIVPARKRTPDPRASRPYTVRLHLCEPDAGVRPSERVFRIVVQGKVVVQRFDAVAETGGALRSVIKCFPGIPVAERLTVELQPLSSRPPVLCGLELSAEE